MIFRDFGTTGDGLVAALQMLRAIRSSGKALGQLARCWTRFPQLVSNVVVREKRPFDQLEGVNKLVAEAEAEMTAQGGRVLLRYSGTEPKARLLLEGRDAMTRFLEEDSIPKTLRFGVRVERVGVKDVVLPGEMKTLLNRVIEAEKEAAANVILRREETAATRSLANTARVMAEQPVLLRLKELESMKEIAARIHEVRVVVGADGLKTLLPAGLLNESNGKHEVKHEAK